MVRDNGRATISKTVFQEKDKFQPGIQYNGIWMEAMEYTAIF